jgi:hypothetical protein
LRKITRKFILQIISLSYRKGKGHMPEDDTRQKFQHDRIQHWNAVSPQKYLTDRPAGFYHSLLTRYYTFIIPPGFKVLELGCGRGDLLASVRPSLGVGLDFSDRMIEFARKKHPHLLLVRGDVHALPFNTKFDFIILSDLVNDVWDVQRIFQNIKQLCHQGTRVVLNFFNEIWRPVLAFARKRGWGVDVKEQSWLSVHDIKNLMRLSGLEPVNISKRILLPLNWPVMANVLNRYAAHLFPFNLLALSIFIVSRPIFPPPEETNNGESVSVVVPARNEAGNIKNIIEQIPNVGTRTEIIFVEGGSRDNTFGVIEEMADRYPGKNIHLFRQKGHGKGDAVRLGFEKATGDILMILDADLTVSPEDLPLFYEAIHLGKGEFINGVRLVYPMEDHSMRLFNKLGNKFFSWAFTWLLGQPIKDTLCGTKVLRKADYQLIARNRPYFGEFDPFGDFDLLFGAAKLNLRIVDMPIRYRARKYGDTNISRWKHGIVLLRMVIFAARRIRFI